ALGRLPGPGNAKRSGERVGVRGILPEISAWRAPLTRPPSRRWAPLRRSTSPHKWGEVEPAAHAAIRCQTLRLLRDPLGARAKTIRSTENSLSPRCLTVPELDGYTLLAAQPAPLTTNVVLYKKLNFDPARFEPLAIMTSIPNTLTVRLDFLARSVAELIAYAKANPGKVNFGSQGVGTTPHLTGELFARVTGTSLTHVPYRGTAQAVNDLVAGNVDMLFFQLDSVREQYRAGKAKMLAVTTPARIPSVAEV